MKYAYEDLSVLIYNQYEYISGWEFVTDPNSSGNNLKNDSSYKVSENMLQYNQSLAEAKPFPGLFLDSAE
jgi:hypothetical protein